MKKKLQPLNDEIKVYQSLPLLLVCCELLSSVDQEDTYFDPNGRVTGKIALRAPEVRKTVSASLITKRPIVWPCSNSSTYNDWSQVFDLIFFYEQFFVVNRGSILSPVVSNVFLKLTTRVVLHFLQVVMYPQISQNSLFKNITQAVVNPRYFDTGHI